jgi:SAM-dependent methyltransferase
MARPGADGAPDYDKVAGLYDALGLLYTGGQIGRLKQRQLRHLAANQRVLYAGVGTGQELSGAVAAGAIPTALDTSPRMLARARRRLANPESVRFCCEDIFEHRPRWPYDVVVANFFLNVFSRDTLPHVLERLSNCLTIGGTLLIGDFTGPEGGFWAQSLQRAYYLPPLLLFALLTKNPWHPLYDYSNAARRAGFTLVEQEHVRIFSIGPPWLSTLKFVKHADGLQ